MRLLILSVFAGSRRLLDFDASRIRAWWASTASRERVRSATGEARYLLASGLIGLLAGAYFVLRYGGHWAEIDTVNFARMLIWMEESGRLTYPGAYEHGFAYSVWATTLSSFTGIPSHIMSRLLTPLVGNLFLAIFGFAAFRRWLDSDRLGLVAAVTLFLVPELVFTMARGNHEKLTVALTLLASLSLLSSFVAFLRPGRWGVGAAWTVVFYLTVFTMVSLNSFFGSTFIVALTVAWAGASVIMAFAPRARRRFLPVLRRLGLMTGTSWILVLLIVLYVYPQPGKFSLLNTVIVGIQNFLAPAPDQASVGVNPYTATQGDWVTQSGYLVLTIFRWLLLGGSFLTWLILLGRALRDLAATSLSRLILLALYGGYGFLMAIGVPIDFLGLDAGSNLQVRLFSYFSLFAVALLVIAVDRIRNGLERRVSPKRVTTWFAGAMFAFMVLSFMKATLDPAFSNRWLHYSGGEVQAMHTWAEIQEQDDLWTGPDYRLVFSYLMETGRIRPPNGNDFDINRQQSYTKHALYSPLKFANAAFWSKPQPSRLYDGSVVYDNGDAQLYLRKPLTPFQD